MDNPVPIPPRDRFRDRLITGIMALLAFTFLLIVVIVLVLPKVAPAPLQFLNNPSPVASNPSDPDHWDFSNPDPTFHPGDALIVEVLACVSDPLGGTVIHASGFRRLVSATGLVSDELDGTDTPVNVRPCSTSRANVGTVSQATPSGRYRVEATVHGTTALYTRDSQWYTIWFEVLNP
jgi:hypothetical protein